MPAGRWEPDLPEEFRDAGVLAFIAAMLAWREGQPKPVMPVGVTVESLPALLAKLEDPKVRRAVVLELSVLVPAPGRKLRRRR